MERLTSISPLERWLTLLVVAVPYGAPVYVSFIAPSDQGEAFFLRLLTVILATGSVYLLQRNALSLLFYFQLLSFALLTYGIQKVLGPEFLVGNQLSNFTGLSFAVFGVHIVCCLIGHQIRFRRRAKTDYADRQPGLLMVVLGCALAAGLMIAVLGAERLFLTRFELYQLDVSAGSLSKALEYFAKLSFFVAAISALNWRSGSSTRWVAPLLLIVVALFFANPTNTPRYISMTGLLAFAIALLLRSELSRWIQLFIGLLPVALTIVQPITSLMRAGLGQVNTQNAVDIYRSLEFSSIEVYLNGIRIYRDQQEIGNHTVSALFAFVPRSIWPEKSEGIGVEIASQSGFVFNNVALPSFANSFIDYGWVGVIVLSFVLGALLRNLSLSTPHGFSFWRRQDMYGLLVFSVLPIFARGDFSSATLAAYPLFASYEFVRFLARIRVRRVGF